MVFLWFSYGFPMVSAGHLSFSPPDALHLSTAGAELQLHVAGAFEEHLPAEPLEHHGAILYNVGPPR